MSILRDNVRAVRGAQSATPQNQPTPGKNEVVNNAGGYVFAASDQSNLERFLILGTDSGTYYVGEKVLTQQNTDFVKKVIRKNPMAVVDTLKSVADGNRAAKNSPLLYTLVALYRLTSGDEKDYVRDSGVARSVVRTSTHLFEFCNYVRATGGWNRSLRRVVSDFYTTKSVDSLAYQTVKYRQREGWTHRDAFRVAHPQGIDPVVGNFVLGKSLDGLAVPANIAGYLRMSEATSAEQVVKVLNEYPSLPWETIPTQYLNDAKVWKTLFDNDAIGQTALLRNVVRLDKIGMFRNLRFARAYADRLADADRIAKGRVHPVAYLNALGMYAGGMGSLSGYSARYEARSTSVRAALEDGFYASFGSVEPAGVPTMVSLDVSGSMTWDAPAGLRGLDCMEAAAAMAMVAVRTEPYAMVNSFSTGMQSVNITKNTDLNGAFSAIGNAHFGGTDCAQPMVHAKENKLDIDHFQIYTDNETWAGSIKPFQARRDYRSTARVSVVGMVSNGFSIADDSGYMIDFVGFDSAAPRVMADFGGGRI